MSHQETPEDEILAREKFLNSLAETYLIQDAILNATELSVISVTKDGIINSINRAAEKMLGYKPEELIGKESPVVFHDWAEIEERAAELSQELGYSIKAGFESFAAKVRDRSIAADRREWTYIHKDGTRIPVLLSISGIWSEQGDLNGFLGIATDITEQKKANEELTRSRVHLETLMASIDDMLVEVDNKGVFRNIWTKDEGLLLAPREKVIGYHFTEVLQEPLLSLYANAIKKVFATRKSEYIEYAVPREGQFRSCKISYANQNSILLLIRDISEKKLAEQRLTDSERKFRLLAENFSGTIYLCRNDAAYSMVYLNSNVEELTGYRAAEFFDGSINFVQLYHPEDSPTIFKEVDEALTNQRKFNLVYRIRHKSGEWKWIEEHGIGVYDGKQLQLIEGYLVDITDRKKSEQDLVLSKNNLEGATLRLQEQNDQLNEFTHILSHNLRSPVGNIGALISLLNEKSTLKDYQEIFSNLKKTAGSLQDTLNELIQTIQINKGALNERTMISFEATLNKVKADLAGEILSCNAIIISDFFEVPEILFSKPYLESIFLNLLSNALKYRSPQRQVQVTFKTELNNGRITLKVADNGLGIDMEKYGSQLFGLRKTFHQHKDSKGVGLFLTKTQIKSMGGDISAVSRVDVGTTFIVEF